MTNQEIKFLNDQSFRQKVIKELKSEENRRRMASSLQDTEVYNGTIRPYVIKALKNKGYSNSNVKEMPIVASVNVTRKVVDNKASLYKTAPNRDFHLEDDELEDQLDAVYSDAMIDSKMLQANRIFELQNRQTHVMCIPKMGKLKTRVLKAHQLNVIPSEDDAEVGEIYIISSYDKYESGLRENFSNNLNENIADKDDYKSSIERYLVWSSNLHFIMDGTGAIKTEEVANPIAPICPVIEIAPEKDFEYWCQPLGNDGSYGAFGGGEISNFSVEYNLAMSMLSQTVEMNSFAQAWLKGPLELQPAQLIVGPTKILRLITDPNAPNGDTDFGFSSPNADIGGAQNYVLSLLAQFLSSQGINAKSISGNPDAGEAFSSGVERLLSMVEKFEASKETMAVFEHAEMKLFEVIKAWINLELLDYDFKIPEDSTMSIVYEKPEAVLTEQEKLDIIEKKIDLQLITKRDALMELYNLSRDEAEERAQEIEEEWMLKPKATPSITSNLEYQESDNSTMQPSDRSDNMQ